MTGETASSEDLEVRCCIVGGGPAGMMLGLLLARAGIDVLILEKHADFLRDFRGDTLHPSTLELMHELGLADQLLQLPHQQVTQLRAHIGAEEFVIADFSRLPTRYRFLALMPQWDFLTFVEQQARRYPTFHLKMQAEVTEVIQQDDRITGVQVKTPGGIQNIRAELVVAADGRNSILRNRAGLKVDDLGAPMDALWVRLSRKADDPSTALRFDRGKILILIDRGSYWQCAFVIRKGEYDEMQCKGLDSLRADIVEIAPFLHDRVGELRNREQLKLLSVRVDRLRQWYRPGLLCIGDAAHAMSPVGGVGINLAIQDAVAAANKLVEPLRKGVVTTDCLAGIQKRRMFPTRLTQRLQLLIQKHLISRVLATSARVTLPFPVRVALRSKVLGRIRGRMMGMGLHPEHIRTPDAYTGMCATGVSADAIETQ
jgi:2-polyprenyl-6-methoxyphenol hydroxylase-like FAD-dependent oxidoreductase